MRGFARNERADAGHPGYHGTPSMLDPVNETFRSLADVGE